MNAFARLPVLLCAAGLFAQEPVLHASEVAAFAKLQSLLRQPAGVPATYAPFELGYALFAIGEDRAGSAFQGKVDGIDPSRPSVLFLQPIRDSLHPARLMFGTRSGRIFLGQPPANAPADWQPSLASIISLAGRQTIDPVSIEDMLLQSGTAQDDTTWERAEAIERDGTRELTLRVTRTDGSEVDYPVVEIGSTRLPWHPAWLAVDHLPVVATRCHAPPPNAGPDRGVAKVRGLPARGLRLHVTDHGDVVLRPGDVTFQDGELHIRIDRATVAPAKELDDQAWAAQALKFFAEDQLAARAAARIDRDRDGGGEFGKPDEVLALAHRIPSAGDERFTFRNHLFAAHLPADADGAEKHFVAYAWPATAHGPHDLAFFVDERGGVHSCRAHERFHGHDNAPAADAATKDDLGWSPLR